MKRLIKNADVVFPEGVRKADVLIDGGTIAAIDPAAATQVDETIEASGLTLLPGVIDDQVHFREPGLTHKEDLTAASRACAAGGVTTYLEMPNTKPPAITVEKLEEKYRLAAEKSLVNYGFYIGATAENIDQLQAAENIPGIKIFIGSSTGNMLVDEQAALERIFAESTLPICAHCEDETTVRANAERLAGTTDVADHSRIRTVEAAEIATRRATELAQRHRHRFHVLHVSTAAELPYLRAGRPYVTAEACPHHLFFNVDDYPRLGTRIQMNPSVKTRQDNEALWEALRDGTIQVIATDHAPHTLEEKAQSYPASPSGLPAVENSLPLMLNAIREGRCTLPEVVHWMCDAPARVWGLVGKGRIAEGYDADLVLVDLGRTREVRDENQYTKSRWSPWHGTQLTGWPVQTIVGGTTVFEEGRFNEAFRGSRPTFDHSRGGYWATEGGIGL